VSAQSKAAAVALAELGWAHYEADRYTEALQAFRDAEAKAHAPPFLLMVARCYVKLGRFLEARDTYRLVVDEKLAPGTPPAFADAKASAKKELAELEVRTPTVEVTVTGTVPAGLDLTLDGLSIQLSTPVQRDPGAHTLVVRIPGRRPLIKAVPLTEGTRERVELDQAAIDALPTVERPAAESMPSPSGSDRAVPSISSTSTTPRDNMRRAVLLGGGIAAGGVVAAGVVLTVLANGRASDAIRLRAEVVAEDQEQIKCPTVNPQKCSDLSDAVDARVTLSNSALWSFVAGGAVGVGTLIYGLVTMESVASGRGVQVTPLWGPQTVGISASGSF
jgi:pentatricopeptide repeat protein